jgi:hypothetical protein
MGIHNLLHLVESEILRFITEEGLEHVWLVFIRDTDKSFIYMILPVSL